jgi:hypothetical protein
VAVKIGSGEGKQHVDYYRKYLLRKRMLRWATQGDAYVPFIGDGDLAVDLYADRKVYGADLDPERVLVAQERLPISDVRVADCDSWPFTGEQAKFAIADFDAYSDPYTNHHDRLVLFFTDGRRQGFERTGSWTKPDGSKVKFPSGSLEKAAAFNFYLPKHIWPWFDDYVKPWRVLQRMRYLRAMMVYWAVAIERPRRVV